MKHSWCDLNKYEVAVQQRLNSSKDVIVLAEMYDDKTHKTYKRAKGVCENICGRLYLPSTLKENDEVESVLDVLGLHGNVWLRMTYNDTVGTWYDPDNQEDLTFLNFDYSDTILDCTDNFKCGFHGEGTKEHHAVIDNDGKWWSRSGNNKYSEYVLCEQT